MRGVIIGFGVIATGHAYGYQRCPELSVTAVVDPTPARLAIAARDFGLRGYATLEEALAAEAPDFVDICTPPHLHREYMVRALEHGRHVLCEKPVFLPAAGGYQRLLDDLRRANVADRVLYPCHNYKFAPILQLMEGIVRSPEFGEVMTARFRTLRHGHALGVAEWNPHWRRERRYSFGGILRDHGPHSLYLLTQLTGLTPVAVSCLAGSLAGDDYPTTEDTALLTIRCETGEQISLDLSWSSSRRNSYYSVVGTRGSIIVENDEVSYSRGTEVVRTTLPSDFDDPTHRSWFARMFEDFRDMVDHPDRQHALIQEAIMTSLVIDAGYESMASDGQWVECGSSLRSAAAS